MKRFLILALASVAPTSIFAGTPVEPTPPIAPTHCAPEEKVIFSCKTAKNKVFSICSSPSLTSKEGYLQYRFGFVNKPEFIYPAIKEHPSKHFQYGRRPYAGGGAEYLQFENDGYTYFIFSGFGQGAWAENGPSFWSKLGVVVKKSGKQVAHLECGGGWTDWNSEFLEKAEIPRDPNENHFTIP